jgi:hypothetical protein
MTGMHSFDLDDALSPQTMAEAKQYSDDNSDLYDESETDQKQPDGPAMYLDDELITESRQELRRTLQRN